jgi:hypothetical protein
VRDATLLSTHNLRRHQRLPPPPTFPPLPRQVTLRTSDDRNPGFELEELTLLVNAVLAASRHAQEVGVAIAPVAVPAVGDGPTAGDDDDDSAGIPSASPAAAGAVPVPKELCDHQGNSAAVYLEATAKLLGHITSVVTRNPLVCTATPSRTHTQPHMHTRTHTHTHAHTHTHTHAQTRTQAHAHTHAHTHTLTHTHTHAHTHVHGWLGGLAGSMRMSPVFPMPTSRPCSQRGTEYPPGGRHPLLWQGIDWAGCEQRFCVLLGDPPYSHVSFLPGSPWHSYGACTRKCIGSGAAKPTPLTAG